MSDKKTEVINKVRSTGAIALIAFMVYTEKEFAWYIWAPVGLAAWGVVPPQDFNSIMDSVVRIIHAWKGVVPTDKK